METAYITLFPRAAASLDQSKTVEMSWDQISEHLTEFAFVEEKTESILFLPVRFVDGATSKEKKYVKDVWLATLDVDGVSQDEYEALRDWLNAEDYKAVIYSTFRHVDSARGIGKKGEAIDPELRLRVVLPLSRPVSAVEWKYFWAAYNQHFHGLADQSCKDPSRGYFVPAIDKKYEGTPEADLAFSEVLEGSRVVDVDWLLDSYKGDIKKDSGEIGLPDQDTAHSVDRSLVIQLARRLKNRKRTDLQVIGAKMLQGIKGEIFEAAGNRDNMLFKIAKELAHAFPEGKSEDLSRPFDTSLSAMAEESGDEFDGSWLRSKVLRAQATEQAELEKKRLAKEEQEIQQARQDAKKAERIQEFKKEDVQEFLRENGVSDDIDDFRFIISYKASYYLFNGWGYSGPYVAADLLLACQKHLEVQARNLGFSMVDVIQRDDGPPTRKPRKKDQILSLYGAVASNVVYNLEGKSYYDPESDKLHLSEVVPSQLEPKFVPEVDNWIKTICYNEDQAERFRDLLSQIPNVSRALAALCIVGPADAGKSALAEGISRLWGHAPVPMDVALGTFNEELLRCPVVLADEDLPRDNRGRVQTELIRKFISGNTHSINRKGIPRVNLEGNLRCIVTLNNIANFSFGHARHSKQDVEAIQKRFFVLEILRSGPDCSSAFDYDLFVTEGAIAQHIMWLNQNRERAEDRFGVETQSSAYVALGDENAVQVMDYIMDYVDSVKAQDEENRFVSPSNIKPVVVLPNNRLLVYQKALFEEWELFGDMRHRPSRSKLSSTLSSICLESKKLTVGTRRNVRNFWEVDMEIFRLHLWRRSEDAELMMKKLDIYYDIDICTEGYQPTSEEAEKRDAAIKYLTHVAVDEEESAAE